jgi:ABC-type sugar transport system substrate-binding protein
MLTGNPDAKIIVSDATEMGVGVASFLERTNKKDIVNITSDSNHELVRYLRNGYIAAVRYASPAEGGVLSAMAIRQFLETGKKPPHKMRQPHQMVTKADLTPATKSWLINPNLKPASGYICYDPLLPTVRKW